MKKYNWTIYFFILLPSCIGIKNQNSVEIDLSKTVPSIKYSTFVKNIEYVDLHLNDSLPIYGVENLYLDEYLSKTGNRKVFLFLMLSQVNF